MIRKIGVDNEIKELRMKIRVLSILEELVDEMSLVREARYEQLMERRSLRLWHSKAAVSLLARKYALERHIVFSSPKAALLIQPLLIVSSEHVPLATSFLNLNLYWSGSYLTFRASALFPVFLSLAFITVGRILNFSQVPEETQLSTLHPFRRALTL
jgi:hypothetical protein